jgi:hypothetical protein
MALQGNLRDFSVNEILQLLGTQNKTGCLLLEWNTERAKVYVHDGRMVGTRDQGMSEDDPLLQFLVKVHRISDEQRRGLMSVHKESGRDLEDLLLTGRYMEPEELKNYIERQILNDIMRLVRWESGTYRFDPKARWQGSPLVKLSMDGALIEAARRGDEQKGFVTKFKDPYQLLGMHDLPDPDEPLSEEEKELFGLIDGNHTVAEVVDAAPLMEYEAYESLSRMLDAGWIVVVGRRDPGVTLTPSPVRASRPAPRRISWGHEALVGALVVGSLLVLPIVGRALRGGQAAVAVESDPFAAAAVRDARIAIELYRREHGQLPGRLDDLVAQDWLSARQLEIPGHRIEYRVESPGYVLELKPVER